MNLQVFKILLFVATSIILLSTAYAQISGKINTDTSKAAPASSPTANLLKPQTTCPVMGGKINRELYVDYNGKRIYVCCTDCIEQVAKDPEKYIKKLASMGQGVETITNQTKKADSAGTSRMPTTSMNMKRTDTTAIMTVASEQAGYWTCTMNPGIRKTESGNCPICGMKLVFRKSDKDTTSMMSSGRAKVKK